MQSRLHHHPTVKIVSSMLAPHLASTNNNPSSSQPADLNFSSILRIAHLGLGRFRWMLVSIGLAQCGYDLPRHCVTLPPLFLFSLVCPAPSQEVRSDDSRALNYFAEKPPLSHEERETTAMCHLEFTRFHHYSMWSFFSSGY